MIGLLKKFLDPTFFRFILVGIINTLVGTGVMFGLYNVAGLYLWGDRGYWIASAANYVVGSVVSYFLNKHFTFRNTEKGVKVILRFIINIAVCWVRAYGIARPLTRFVLGGLFSDKIVGNLSMLCGMVLFVCLNYIGQRFFTFKKQ